MKLLEGLVGKRVDRTLFVDALMQKCTHGSFRFFCTHIHGNAKRKTYRARIPSDWLFKHPRSIKSSTYFLKLSKHTLRSLLKTSCKQANLEYLISLTSSDILPINFNCTMLHHWFLWSPHFDPSSPKMAARKILHAFNQRKSNWVRSLTKSFAFVEAAQGNVFFPLVRLLTTG